jgi:uncharacterized protein (DUF433 family)
MAQLSEADARDVEAVIARSPDVLGGTLVFAGTRVPVRTLLDYLEAGDRLDDFLADFPTVRREHASTPSASLSWPGGRCSRTPDARRRPAPARLAPLRAPWAPSGRCAPACRPSGSRGRWPRGGR